MKCFLIAVFGMLFGGMVWGGSVKVPDVLDVVHLKDARPVKGTVLIAGSRSVVILVKGSEREIPRENVTKIEYGGISNINKSYVIRKISGTEKISDASDGNDKKAVIRKIPPEIPVPSETVKKVLNDVKSNPKKREQLKKLLKGRGKEIRKKLENNNILINKEVRKLLDELSKQLKRR